MKKTHILMFTLAFLVVFSGFAMANGDVISQIEDLKQKPLIDIDTIKEKPELMPETIIKEDNTASVKTLDREATVDKFEASNNEEIRLYVSSSETINRLCFIFPVDLKYISITNINVDVPFWFDTNLKNKEVRDNNTICFEQIDIQNNELYYSAEYKPAVGMPQTIKYDINIDGLVLDPYLIGQLATSSQLSLYLPFNGNSLNSWASILNSVNVSSLRYNDTITLIYDDYAWSDLSLFTDQNIATRTSASTSSSSGFFFEIPRKVNDTGAILFIRMGVSGGSFDYSYDLNMTVDNTCFNTYTDRVNFKVSYTTRYVGGLGTSQTTTFSCFNGGTYTTIYTDTSVYRSFSWIYGGGMYITNQSGFSSYSYPTVKTQYYNTNGLVWSNSFAFWGNNSVNGLKNEVNTSQTGVNYTGVYFNNSGANFNTSNNYINISSGKIFLNTSSITLHSKFSVINGSANGIISGLNNTYIGGYFFGVLDNKPICGFRNANSLTSNDIYGDIIQNNVEYVVTCTYNNLTQNASMYLNGNLINSTIFITGMSKMDIPDQFFIGSLWNLWYMNGTISDVKIYNRSLSSDEIYNLYRGGNFTENKLGEANSSIYLNGNEAIRVQNNSLGGITAYSTSQWVKSNISNRAIWFGHHYLFNQYLNSGTSIIAYNGYNNQWNNIITTNNGSISKLYLNGVLISQNTANLITTTSFQLGSYNGIEIGLDHYYLNGSIDEFMLYNYVLSDSEIRTLSNGYSTNDIDDCSTYNNSLLNINVFDENNPTQSLNSTFDVFMQYYLYNDTTTLYNFSRRYDTTRGTNFSVCFANMLSDINYDLYAQYTPPGSFTHRYYLFNQTYQNQTVFISVGNYQNKENVSRLNLVVRDQDRYEPVIGIVGKLQRFYVQEGIWRNIQMDKTADYGLLVYNVREADTDYRIVFTDEDNHIYKTTNSMKFSCSYGVCDLTYVLDTDILPIEPNLQISYFYDNQTNNLTINWTDTNTVTSNFHVKVRKNYYNGIILICDKNISNVAGSIVCDLTGYNGTIDVTIYSSASPEEPRYSFSFKATDAIKKLFEYSSIGVRDGTFYAFGMSLIGMMAGIFNPVVAILLGILSIFLSFQLQLTPLFTTTMITIMCIIGIIIGVKVRQ